MARATQAAGGSIVGVIPRSMMAKEVAFEAAEELILVDTMRERKQEMDDRADAFVVLPGGFGTLEELAEAVTPPLPQLPRQAGGDRRRRGLLAPLRTLFEHFESSGFAGPAYREAYRFVATAEEAIASLGADGSASSEPVKPVHPGATGFSP